MTEPTFGISIQPLDNELRTLVFSDFSVIGIIGTADAADAGSFPLDTPVAMNSNDAELLADLGATGSIVDAIRGINDQLAAMQGAARLVIVRVAYNATADTVIANIVGNGTTTGLAAFKAAPAALGMTPRIILAPDYTGQTKTGVLSVPVTAGGTNYTTPTVAFSGGGGTGAAGTVTVASGVITGIVITNPGSGYTSAPTATISGSPGSGATLGAVSIGALANPVVAALPAVLEALQAVAPVQGPNSTKAAALAWRETFTSKRLIPVEGGVKTLDGQSIVSHDLAPRLAGICVKLDKATGGVPVKSWANQPVQGILAPGRSIPFSLTDGANEGQELLAENIGVLVRGEAGVDGAIADAGFVFIGTDGAGDDDAWRFYHQVRLRDYAHVALIKTLRFYLGRYNLTAQLVQAVLNTMDRLGSQLQGRGYILGYQNRFTPDANSVNDLRAGKFTTTFAAEEPAVFRNLVIQSTRYEVAVEQLLSDLVAQFGGQAAA
jgi:phage tail sheath protein FI